MKLTIFLIIVSVLSLSACQTDTTYHQYREVPSAGWSRKDTISFPLPADFTYHRYALEIGLRHTEAYPYKDLWVEIIHPLTPVIPPDTIHLRLADKKGNWFGAGSSNCLYQFTQSLGTITCYPADSLLQVTHLMSTPLTGITDIGIRLSLPRGIDTKEYKQ